MGLFPVEVILTDDSEYHLSRSFILDIAITGNLSDSTGVSPASASYLRMNSSCYEMSGHLINRNALNKSLSAYIASIDQFGNVRIVFSENMMTPEPMEPLLIYEALKITLRKYNGTNV